LTLDELRVHAEVLRSKYKAGPSAKAIVLVHTPQQTGLIQRVKGFAGRDRDDGKREVLRQGIVVDSTHPDMRPGDAVWCRPAPGFAFASTEEPLVPQDCDLNFYSTPYHDPLEAEVLAKS